MTPTAKPIILLHREQATLASCWGEMLGLRDEGDGHWTLAVYGYEWLGSIVDLVPENKLYDKNGEFKVPKKVDGHRILGLEDGEYLVSDKLMRDDNEEAITFDKLGLDLARDYLARNEWDKHRYFEAAWNRLLKRIASRAAKRR